MQGHGALPEREHRFDRDRRGYRRLCKQIMNVIRE